MRIEFDLAKRHKTLIERGLDFASAGEVFSKPLLNQTDSRVDYGEKRTITFGLLGSRWVVVVRTLRADVRRIISMRYANEREIAFYAKQVA